MKEPFLNPPVFILGIQRAGTTLLNQLLSNNGQLKVLERETHLYILLWNISNKLPFGDNKELANFLFYSLPIINKGWTNEGSLQTLKEITENIKATSKKIDNVDELMSFFLHFWQKKYPNLIVGEKTPGHIFYLSLLIKKFPDARFIIMVRDPRACYISENTKLINAQSNPININTFITRWASVSFLARFYQNKYPQQVQVFKYEELILSPENTLRQACSFLGIDFSDKMLEAKVTNSSFQDTTQKDKSFNTENIDRWKDNLQENYKVLISKTLSKEINFWGYERLSSKGTSPLILVKSLVLKLIIGASNLFCLINAPLFHHLNRNTRYKVYSKK